MKVHSILGDFEIPDPPSSAKSEAKPQTPFLDALRRKMAETPNDDRLATRDTNNAVVSSQNSNQGEGLTSGLLMKLFFSGKLGEYMDAITEIRGEGAKASLQQQINSKLRIEQQEHWEREFDRALETLFRELERVEKKCRKFPGMAKPLARTPVQQFVLSTIPPEWARDTSLINEMVDHFMNEIE